MRKGIIGGIAAIAGVAAVITIGIAANAGGSTATSAAPASAPVEVTKTVIVTAPPKTVTVTAPPVTVTAVPAVPTVKSAAEYQVTYRLNSSEDGDRHALRHRRLRPR